MADLPITSDQGATPIVINDPTTVANVANVKAASTASVVGDNSLVVALSPNSPVPTGTNKIGVTGVTQGSTTSGQNGDLVQGAVTTVAPAYSTGQTSPLSLTTVGNLRVDGSSVTQPVSVTSIVTNTDKSGSGTITALNGTVVATTNGCSSVIFNVSGTWVATLTIQAQDGDGNWFTTQGLVEPSSVLVQATAGNNVILISCGGFSQVRFIATAFTSGTANISWNAGVGINSAWVYNSNPTALNATVVQPTGTNLHVVLDSGTLTSITNALPTGANTIGAVTQASGPWTSNITQIAGLAISTAATGIAKVGLTDGTGNSISSTSGNLNVQDRADTTIASSVGTASGFAIGTSGLYNTTQPAPTNGQQVEFQADQSGNLLHFPGVQTKTGAAWTSATTINTLQFPTGTTTIGAPLGCTAILVQLNQTTTLTAGAVTFQGTYDGTNWVTIPTAQIVSPAQPWATLTNPYTFVASTQQPFLIYLNGYQQIRLNLTSTITGTGSVTPFWTVVSNTSQPVSGSVSLGTGQGKTVVMKTGTLVTTAVTADQVVLTYTVTTGKTFYLEYFEIQGAQTTPSGGTGIILGNISLENPSGTKVISGRFIGGGSEQIGEMSISFPEPIPVPSATVIRVVTTPAATTSMTWLANFGGYEK